MYLFSYTSKALKATLSAKPNGVDNWKTAVFYQLLHSVAILSLSAIDRKALQHPPSPKSWSGGKIMAVGTVRSTLSLPAMFSGSIYCLTLDIGPKKIFGPMTPVGGLFLIAGWALVGMGNI